MTLSKILCRALTTRLYPYSDISPKHIAYFMGVSRQTLWRWTHDVHDMPAEALLGKRGLIAFFLSRGDLAFEREIMAAIPRETLLQVNGEPGWQVERLHLDDLRHPTAQRLAALASTESDLLTAADNAGLLRECATFRVLGNEVICLTIGSSSGMRKSIRDSMMGLPLDRWPDGSYARVVRDHVVSAQRDGPSYHHLNGTVQGIRAPYKRSIFPAGDFAISFTEREAA